MPRRRAEAPGQLRLALSFDDREHELPRESAELPPGWTAAGVVERAEPRDGPAQQSG